VFSDLDTERLQQVIHTFITIIKKLADLSQGHD
jgi:hypothetical protein